MKEKIVEFEFVENDLASVTISYEDVKGNEILLKGLLKVVDGE